MKNDQRNRMVVAGVTAAAGIIAVAQAASGATVLKNGDTLDGWKVTFPAGITLVAEDGNTLALHKGATFDSAEGLDITFTQTSPAASPTITLLDESVTNNTAAPFNSFQFLLLNTLPGDAAPAAFDSAANTFKQIAPFTKSDFSSDTITLSGGSLAAGDTAHFGGGTDGGSLVIDAHPAASGLKKVLDFKEIPTTGPASVPLPSAVWSGLSMLAGLGLIGLGKNARRLIN